MKACSIVVSIGEVFGKVTNSHSICKLKFRLFVVCKVVVVNFVDIYGISFIRNVIWSEKNPIQACGDVLLIMSQL